MPLNEKKKIKLVPSVKNSHIFYKVSWHLGLRDRGLAKSALKSGFKTFSLE